MQVRSRTGKHRPQRYKHPGNDHHLLRLCLPIHLHGVYLLERSPLPQTSLHQRFVAWSGLTLVSFLFKDITVLFPLNFCSSLPGVSRRLDSIHARSRVCSYSLASEPDEGRLIVTIESTLIISAKTLYVNWASYLIFVKIVPPQKLLCVDFFWVNIFCSPERLFA